MRQDQGEQKASFTKTKTVKGKTQRRRHEGHNTDRQVETDMKGGMGRQRREHSGKSRKGNTKKTQGNQNIRQET